MKKELEKNYNPKDIEERLYTKWVTKQKPSKSRNTHKGNGILGDAVADVAARAIVGAVTAPKRKYKLCRAWRSGGKSGA